MRAIFQLCSSLLYYCSAISPCKRLLLTSIVFMRPELVSEGTFASRHGTCQGLSAKIRVRVEYWPVSLRRQHLGECCDKWSSVIDSSSVAGWTNAFAVAGTVQTVSGQYIAGDLSATFSEHPGRWQPTAIQLTFPSPSLSSSPPIHSQHQFNTPST